MNHDRVLLENVVISAGGRRLVEEMSTEFFARGKIGGSIVALFGPSGVGKTTFLRTLARLRPPDGGRVKVEAGREVYLAQRPVIFDHLSTKRNLEVFRGLAGTRRSFSSEWYREASRILEVEHLLELTPTSSDLSGGEQQRVALARAFSLRPSLLFLDEPCKGLHASLHLAFLAFLRRYTDSEGALVFFVTHEWRDVRLVADRLIYWRDEDGVQVAQADDVRKVDMNRPSEDLALIGLAAVTNRLRAYIDGRVVRVGNKVVGYPERCKTVG